MSPRMSRQIQILIDYVLLEGLSSYGHMVIWLCLDCMRKQMQIGMDMEYVRKCCRSVDALFLR